MEKIKGKHKDLKGAIFINIARGLFFFLILILLLLLGKIFIEGAPVLSFEFLFDEPRNNMMEGGIWPAIFGTLAVTFIMILFAVPLGVFAAIYWCAAHALPVGPHSRSEILFSAHMAQHEILILVSAPLMVLGRPMLVVLWALPPSQRSWVGRRMRHQVLLAMWSAITGPLVVLLLHAVVLWVWHVPALFEAALADETVHVLQHLSFFVTAVLFWWALIHGRYGRAGYGVGVAYVFATAMHTQILGALLAFGTRVWYPTHAARTGAGALEDQQLAGIVMWVPFGVIFVVISLALFAAWLGEIERRVAYTTADQLAREPVAKKP